MAMLAGADLIYGAGLVDMGMSFDYSQFVADNDIIRMMRRVTKGITVDDETMAVDLIHKIGPRGHFLMEEHTVAHMQEHCVPRMIDRETRDVWEERGAQNYAGKAQEKAIEILENYKPAPLPPKVIENMRSFIEEREKEYAKK